MRNYRGFSLIEIMVVVSIIGILASVALPAYLEYVQRGARGDAKSMLMVLSAQQEDYFSQNGTYTTEISGSPGLGLGSIYTVDGYYTVTSSPCSGGLIGNCFQLTATAATNNSQINDYDCRTLTLTSTGIKTATNAGGAANANCW